MIRRNAVVVAWVAAAAILALGAAGIVTALDHLPGGPGRPELTWSADRAVAPTSTPPWSTSRRSPTPSGS